MVSALGRRLERVDGFKAGDGTRDSSVYLDGHTAVAEVVGRDAGAAAFVVRALDPRTNAPTEVFRVNKDGSVSWVGVPKNVLDYGAAGTGAGDDLAAIHAAVDALPAGGGTVYFPAGSYRITGPITNRGKHGVTFLGDGRNATVIQPSSASVDAFSFGTTGAEAGDYLAVRDLQVSGGRYGLRLNNCLDGTFERLLFSGCVCGVYAEGQNEKHTLRDVRISSSTTNGMNLGNTNGGTGAVALDLPLFARWTVDALVVDHTAGGPAIKLGAGVLGGQQTSGFSQFTNVACLVNSQGAFEVTNCTMLTIQHYTGDSNAHGNEGAYHDVRLVAGSATGTVRLADAYFTAAVGDRPGRYTLAPAGALHLERCYIAVAGMSTEGYAFNGGLGSVTDCVAPTAAGALLLSGGSIGKVAVRNLTDASGDQAVPDVVNQGAATGEALALRQASVAHGMTGVTGTDTYGMLQTQAGASGGLGAWGLNDTGDVGVAVYGVGTTANTTKNASAAAAIQLDARKKSGTGTAAMGANENLLVIQTSGSTRFIFDADGDSLEDGTGWTAYDDHDDRALLEALDTSLDARLRAEVGDWLSANKAALEAARIVHFNEDTDGRPFVNRSRLQMLLVGAVRQQAARIDALEQRLALAEGGT